MSSSHHTCKPIYTQAQEKALRAHTSKYPVLLQQSANLHAQQHQQHQTAVFQAQQQQIKAQLLASERQQSIVTAGLGELGIAMRVTSGFNV